MSKRRPNPPPRNEAADAVMWLRARYGRDVLTPLGPQPRARDLAHGCASWLVQEYGSSILAPLGRTRSTLWACLYVVDMWGRSSAAASLARAVVALRALGEVLDVYRSADLLRVVIPFVLPGESGRLWHEINSAELVPAELLTEVTSPASTSGYPALSAVCYAVKTWGRSDAPNRARAVRALQVLVLELRAFGCANRARAVIRSGRAELWPLIAPDDDDGRALAPLPGHVDSEGPR